MLLAALKLNIAHIVSFSRTNMGAKYTLKKRNPLFWNQCKWLLIPSFSPQNCFPPQRGQFTLICPGKADSCLLWAIVRPDPSNSWEAARNWGVKAQLIYGKGQLEMTGKWWKAEHRLFSIEEQFSFSWGIENLWDTFNTETFPEYSI